MLIWKNFLLDVHPHVEKQLKQKLADSQILADHLTLFDWVNVFEFCLFMRAWLKELFYFEDFLGYFHHSEVINFFGGFDSAPFEILSQVNNYRVEWQGKQHIFFQVVINFLNDKAMFLRVVFSEDELSGLVFNLLLKQMSHGFTFNDFIKELFVSADFFLILHIICLENESAPSDVNMWLRLNISRLFFSKLKLNYSKRLTFHSLCYIDQDWSQRIALIRNGVSSFRV